MWRDTEPQGRQSACFPRLFGHGPRIGIGASISASVIIRMDGSRNGRSVPSASTSTTQPSEGILAVVVVALMFFRPPGREIGAAGAGTSISRRTAYRKSFAFRIERHAFVQKRQRSEYPPEARAHRS